MRKKNDDVVGFVGEHNEIDMERRRLTKFSINDMSVQ